MAYYFAICDNIKSLPKDKLALMNIRAVSAYWKMIKKTTKFPYLSKAFGYYLWAKLNKPQPNLSVLGKMYKSFMSLSNIRR